MDYRLALLCGNDLPLSFCQLVVHQPSIAEIALIGDRDFFTGVQCLCLYKSMFVEDKDVLSNINNFQIFMMIMQEKKAKDKKEAVRKVLTLLFPDYNILFTPNSLLLQQKEKETVIIDINNFEQLQEIFRMIFCMKNAPMSQVAFNPAGEKAKEIAKKLQRGRERIAAEKNDTNSSVLSQYVSILSVGLHMPINELIRLTMFQLYDLIERFMLWTNWDLDVRMRLAGGKPDNSPDNWMKNIH